jgi:vacuolar-type H+-ATPase subunit H
MMNQLIPVVAVMALLLAGCKESASETSKDVTQAREEASQEVSEARQDADRTENKSEEKVIDAQQEYSKTDANAREKLTEVESDAMANQAKADFEVAKTEAEGRHNIAVEKCGALEGVDKKACVSTADANFAADEAAATAIRDNALAQQADSNR